MNTRWPPHLLRLATLALCTMLLTACSSPPPPQALLESQFNIRRESYEALVELMLEDGFTTVSDYGDSYSSQTFWWATAEEAGLEPRRTLMYKALMVKAGCQRIDAQDEGALAFFMDSWGMANRGWRVSALWSPEEPENLLPSLDDFEKTSGEWEIAHSRLSDDWYLRIIW